MSRFYKKQGGRVIKRDHKIIKRSFADILLSHREINADGCWLWTRSIGTDGYGQVTYAYKRWSVHRASMKFIAGLEIDGKVVCHKQECTSRLCFNPEHLYLGTFKDNSADCLARGNFHHPAIGYMIKTASGKVILNRHYKKPEEDANILADD